MNAVMRACTFRREAALQEAKDETEALKKYCRGRWDTVLSVVLPELAEAIDAGPRKHVTCPYHGGTGDFRVRNDFLDTGACICSCLEDVSNASNGIGMVMHARDVDFKTAKRLLLDAVGGRVPSSPTPIVRRYREEEDPEAVAKKDANLRRKITGYWDGAVELDAPEAQPARNWLAARGLSETALPIANVRFHPALAYWNGKKSLGEMPALLAMVRGPDGRTSTIHRTYLSETGKTKAGLPEGCDPRKRYPAPSTHPAKGGAIRLDTWECPILSVGEGLETTLSARLIASVPAWSTINKYGLRVLEVPDYVKVVIVWADRDRSEAGQLAARDAVQRFRQMGLRAVAMLPPYAVPDDQKGLDWNDMVMTSGVQQCRDLTEVRAMKERANAAIRGVV